MFANESQAEIWTFFPIPLSPASSLVVDWVSVWLSHSLLAMTYQAWKKLTLPTLFSKKEAFYSEKEQICFCLLSVGSLHE